MQTIPFTPSDQAVPPFSTLLMLDSSSYLFSVFWNLYSQRWYFSLEDENGNLIIHGPLIGSLASEQAINLVFGLFSSTLVYQSDTGNLVVTP